MGTHISLTGQSIISKIKQFLIVISIFSLAFTSPAEAFRCHEVFSKTPTIETLALVDLQGKFKIVKADTSEWTIQFGNGFWLNPTRRWLRYGANAVRLPRMKYSILEEIALSPKNVAENGDLFDILRVPIPNGNNLQVHISKLNQIMEIISGQKPLVFSNMRNTTYLKPSENPYIPYGSLRYYPVGKKLYAQSAKTGAYERVLYSRNAYLALDILLTQGRTSLQVSEVFSAALSGPNIPAQLELSYFSARLSEQVNRVNNAIQTITDGEPLLLNSGHTLTLNSRVLIPTLASQN